MKAILQYRVTCPYICIYQGYARYSKLMLKDKTQLNRKKTFS